MTIKTVPVLENSISLEEDIFTGPSLTDCLNEALRDVGCYFDGKDEHTAIRYVSRYAFEGKIVVATSSWFDPEDEESPNTLCRVDLDRDFAKEWWNVLTEKILLIYVAQHISHYEVESEVFGWGPVTDVKRERIARRCSKEVQEFFAQLD